MNLTRKIVRFCAEEVCRQGRGPIQVAWMVDAWMTASTMWPGCMQNEDQLLQAVILLGSHVEERNPLENFRGVGVRVGDHVCPSPAEVPDLMRKWANKVLNTEITPEEVYKELLLIHPFVDGNGRVGKIVYNALRGTLNKPAMPPNFFNCANP